MDRKNEIIKTGYVGMATNVVIAATKAVVGIVSGSIAIVLDAVNNTADALSSVLTIVGAKLAGKPADDKHPFGYGRIEYFSAVIIAILILFAGVSSLIESVSAVLYPTEQDYSIVTLSVIVATLVVKALLGLYTKRQGQKYNSDSLIASGSECIVDCYLSVATLISALVMFLFGVSLDAYLAVILSGVIIKIGIEMLVSPINELLGVRTDVTLVNEIKHRVKTVGGVRGVYDVVLHDYGPEQKLGALHVEVEDSMTASDLHHLTRDIQRIVYHEFGIFVTVGFYAHNAEGTDAARQEAVIREYVLSLENVLGMHGFYVDNEKNILSFDIVYSFKESHPITLRKKIKEWLQTDYAGFDIYVGLDRNYSE